MGMPSIRVFDSNGKTFQRVEIDGVPITGVSSVTYRADVESVPILDVEITSLIDSGWAELNCSDIRISYTPKTEAEAMKILGIIGKYEGSDGYPVYVVDKEDEF